MALLRFFKVPRHQQYEYKPRYWDPRKEELEERLKRIEDLKGSDTEATKARISSGLRRGYRGDTRERKRQVMRSNMILLGIVIVLLILSYMFIVVYLPEIVNALESGPAEI